MFLFGNEKTTMVSREDALPGRDHPIPTCDRHYVFGVKLKQEVQQNQKVAMFGMGCFWGVERMFWTLDGVDNTMVGYAMGHTPNPTYEEVCTGKTAHNEVVRVVFDPGVIPYDALLRVFWEGHDPTQGMRQGNDRGTQYRSGIYTFSDDQHASALASRDAFAPRLQAAGFGAVTTEILPAQEFFYAEDYHQQYLAKNPAGYCGIGGTGVTCPIGTGA